MYVSEDTAKLCVIVPEEDRDKAKENTAHGEISETVRETIHALAENEEYEPTPEGTTSRKEQVAELIETGEYPSDWSKRRKETFLRDNYLCQNCGDRGGRDGTKKLEAHHVVPAKNGGTHYLSNLVTLCTECHNRI